MNQKVKFDIEKHSVAQQLLNFVKPRIEALVDKYHVTLVDAEYIDYARLPPDIKTASDELSAKMDQLFEDGLYDEEGKLNDELAAEYNKLHQELLTLCAGYLSVTPVIDAPEQEISTCEIIEKLAFSREKLEELGVIKCIEGIDGYGSGIYQLNMPSTAPNTDTPHYIIYDDYDCNVPHLMPVLNLAVLHVKNEEVFGVEAVICYLDYDGTVKLRHFYSDQPINKETVNLLKTGSGGKRACFFYNTNTPNAQLSIRASAELYQQCPHMHFDPEVPYRLRIDLQQAE